jgi:mono/diheme cytochrome c family protein
MKTNLALLGLGLGLCVDVAHADEGRAFYVGGNGIVARVAGRESRNLACAGCHGGEAAGGGEGRTRIPPIDRRSLERGSGTTAYDLPSFIRALTSGVGPDGRRFSLAMPRYEITTAQAEALWRFLETVGSEATAGITPDSITLIIPALPHDHEDAEAFRTKLSHRWQERVPGSIYGRTVRFETSLVGGTGPDLASGFIALGPSFDDDGRLLNAIQAAGIPVLGPRGDIRLEEDLKMVQLQASEEDVSKALSALTQSGTAIASSLPKAQDIASDPVVVSDAESLGSLIGQKQLAGRQILLSLALVRSAPKDILALLSNGATVVALRPAGDKRSDAYITAIAAVIEQALMLCGRDLTRARFLDALKRVRVNIEGWPKVDFNGSTKTGTNALEFVQITR